MKKWIITLVLFFVFLSLSCDISQVFANEEDVEKRIQQYETKIAELHGQANTLSQQLSLINSNIELSELRIETIGVAVEKLEKEIGELLSEIDRLEDLLTKRLELVLHRIPISYKRYATSEQYDATVLGAMLFSNNISDIVTRLKYINKVEQEDAEFYKQLQLTQNNFSERKDTREKKKAQQEALKKQLEDEKRKLDQQKVAKQALLTQTKNSEANYQQLLANARAELLAIKGIISGGGKEVEVGDVEKGSRIASVIEGSSCNSSGTHLHFMVTKKGDSTALNPFSFLKGVSSRNCSAYTCDSGDQDAFNPSGSWDWPLEPTIVLAQGFGNTWAVRNTWVRQIYSSHNGIDITGASTSVKAVQSGKVYRGYYPGNCRLQYVKLVHKDNEYETYYLHVNY